MVMPITETTYNVFISSPSDLEEERARLKEEIERIVLSEGRLHAVRWEDDVPAMATTDAQAEINKLLEKCDVVCGIFKNRFGSPTERAESGTVEEIEVQIEQKKPVMLYFLTPTIDMNKSSPEELEEIIKIKRFKAKYRNKGIYHECQDIDELVRKFLNKDINANIKKIPLELKTSTEKKLDTQNSFMESDEQIIPWYEDRIATHINNTLEKKHFPYVYCEDLTFHENLLLSQGGQQANFLPTTIKTIMDNARVEAFNTKYGRYDYEKDIRSKFPGWASPLYSIIKSTFPNKKKLDVLNVGGNSGLELSQIFADEKYICNNTVVDISNEAIAYGSELYPNVQFVQANMEDSYLDGSKPFDICLCLRAIESRGVFRNAALIQMSKHLKPGGLILISIPNGYIDNYGNIVTGLYDHRTKSFLRDRPITLAKKLFEKLSDYNFQDIRLMSLDTEILVYAKKGGKNDRN